MGAQAVRLSNVDIDNALNNKDFEILFQPIFDLGNGALARMETFVRWRHASLGLLPPGAFISFFESQGRMSELTRYVLNQALAEYREWRGASAPGFSINLAMSDLSDEAFASHFEVILRDCGFPAELITLECPMPAVDVPIDNAAAQFQRLAETGARLAIEVRGRANDFLRQVDPFPFDEIKTGGAAILRFARTVRGPGLSAISELLDIANKANAAITAVGVEDQASLAALRGLGFAAAQGNHLGRVGDLKTFTPSRVNDVRALLGLEPLAQADLHALFRTQAPAPQSAHPAQHQSQQQSKAAPKHSSPAETGDALVERLVARISQTEATEAAPTKTLAAAGRADGRADGSAAASAAAKAAAIARAKRRAAAEHAASEDAPEGDRPVAARDLQERISREFERASGFAPQPPAAEDAPRPAEIDEFDIDASQDAPETSAGTAAYPGQDAATKAADSARSHEPSTQALDSSAAERLEPALAAASPTPAATAGETATMSERDEDDEKFNSAVTASDAEKGADEPALRASLAVGAARAYFRPGLRVGITAHAPAPRARQPKKPELREGQAAPPKSVAPEAATPAEPALAAAQMRAQAPAAESVGDASAGARKRFGAAKGEARSALGDLEADDAVEKPVEPEAASIEPDAAEAAAPQAAPRRPRKTFLNRVVIPYPTHFWPRPVRRYFKRRRAEADARRADRAGDSAQDAAE